MVGMRCMCAFTWPLRAAQTAQWGTDRLAEGAPLGLVTHGSVGLLTRDCGHEAASTT